MTAYSIALNRKGYTYHFHGLEKNGKPQFNIAFASLTTKYFWRVYKTRKRAETELKKVKVFYKKWYMDTENDTLYIKEWSNENDD